MINMHSSRREQQTMKDGWPTTRTPLPSQTPPVLSRCITIEGLTQVHIPTPPRQKEGKGQMKVAKELGSITPNPHPTPFSGVPVRRAFSKRRSWVDAWTSSASPTRCSVPMRECVSRCQKAPPPAMGYRCVCTTGAVQHKAEVQSKSQRGKLFSDMSYVPPPPPSARRSPRGGGGGGVTVIPPPPEFPYNLKKNFLRRLWRAVFLVPFGPSDGLPVGGGAGIAKGGGYVHPKRHKTWHPPPARQVVTPVHFTHLPLRRALPQDTG